MSEPIRLLYAEDSPQDADLTRAHFAEHAPDFELEIVGTGQACLQRLTEGAFDLVLLDHHLPDQDGLDVLRTLFHGGGEVPVVMVTGAGDEDLVVKALRLGAASYVPKQAGYLDTLPDLLRAVLEDHRRKQRLGLLPDAAPRRILYVEHQPMDIELTRRHFAEAAPHLEVFVVGSGAEALERLARPNVYDLLLVDLRMPASSGLELVSEARRRRLPLPPFIMITGKGDEAAAIASLRLGASEYLVKHDGYLDRLPHVIDRAIAHDRLERQSEQLRVELAERKRAEHQARERVKELKALFRLSELAESDDITLDGLCQEMARVLPESWQYPEVTCARIVIDDHEFRSRRFAAPPWLQSATVRVNGSVVGKIEVGYTEEKPEADEGPFLKEERWLVQAVAGQIGHIAQRKQADETLRRSAEAQRAILHTAMDGFWLLDTDGRLLEVNEAYCRMSGYSAEELLVRHVFDLEAAEAVVATAAHLQKVMAQSEDRFESRHRRKDGSTFDVEISVQYRPTEGGRFVAFLRDITERKGAESQRESFESQLRVSQRMESIGSLAGGVAHDFNNLLAVIQSYTGFALDQVRDGDPLRDDLLEVKTATERATALTRQLLAFSRKQVLQPVPLDLNEVTAGVEKMLQRILGEDIDLVQVLAPDLGVVRADPGQLEQVLMNLVVNARDAMPGGGKLTLETANVELDDALAAQHVGLAPGPYVQLAVTDSGCGMDEQTRTRIFEPFFTTKEKGKGTGLGLSTVYGILRQSGGSIEVHSEKGLGSTFKVYLPRELAATATALLPSVARGPSVGTETLLLVEDEAALLRVARRTLEAAGYRVLTAGDGEEALRISAQHGGELHLLLTDVVMPRMSGRVVAEQLQLARPGLKVLYMSGYTDDAIVHHAVLDPGTQFLGKPFSPADLARKVRDVLDAPGRTAPAG